MRSRNLKWLKTMCFIASDLKNIVLKTFVGLCFWLAALPIVAEEKPLTVVTEFLPPYQYYDEAQRLTGYSVEVVTALLQRLHLEVPINVYPWARAFKRALSGRNILIFSIARTQGREANFYWIGNLHRETYALFATKAMQPFDALDETFPYSVAVSRFSVADQMATKLHLPQIERTSNFSQAIGMLLRGRVDLILASELALKNQQQIAVEQIERLVKVMQLNESYSDLYIAMSKNSDPLLVERVKKAYAAMVMAGEISRIKQKWHLDDGLPQNHS